MTSMYRWTLGCLAGLALAGCSATEIQDLTSAGLTIAGQDKEKTAQISGAAGQVAGSLGPMPFETEYAIGGGIALKSFQDRGDLYPNDDLQRYVNSVGLAIVRQTPRNDFPFAFAVVDRDDVNAWAAPGGYVFITSGALKKMKNESELAGVLAHEIGHVTEGHMVKMLQRSQMFQGLASGAAAAMEKNPDNLSKVADAGTDIIFTKGLDQDMEFDSDRVGIEYAALTGYDPNGLLTFLENLQSTQQAAEGGWLTSTHPPLTKRIANLKTMLSGDYAGVTGATNAGRFEKNVTQVLSN